MKIQKSDNKFILTLNEVNILLECPLNFQNIFTQNCNQKHKINVDPVLNELNYHTIDILLISNFSNILSLPFIIKEGFRGEIYATEPTLQFGKLYMNELISYIDMLDYSSRESKFSQFYTFQDLENAIAMITTINFLERKNLFGHLTFYATSSGYAMGSCNWVFETALHKIVYLSKSSSLTAHPKPIDLISLRYPDILLLSDLTRCPGNKPEAMISEFSRIVTNTLQNGGNVLVPVPLSGLTLDLLECLHYNLSVAFPGDISNIPKIYFVCAEAKSSLAYANIFSEWLSPAKQVKVYVPEEPFIHTLMLEQGTLQYYHEVSEIWTSSNSTGSSLSNGSNNNKRSLLLKATKASNNISNTTMAFKTPCVVLAGHPCLKLGPITQFLRVWKGNPKNSIILVDPTIYPTDDKMQENNDQACFIDEANSFNIKDDNGDFVIPYAYRQALSIYAPIYAKCHWCPIDTGFNATHVKKLLKDCKPKQTVVCPYGPVYDAVVQATNEYIQQKAALSTTSDLKTEDSKPASNTPSLMHYDIIALTDIETDVNNSNSEERTFNYNKNKHESITNLKLPNEDCVKINLYNNLPNNPLDPSYTPNQMNLNFHKLLPTSQPTQENVGNEDILLGPSIDGVLTILNNEYDLSLLNAQDSAGPSYFQNVNITKKGSNTLNLKDFIQSVGENFCSILNINDIQCNISKNDTFKSNEACLEIEKQLKLKLSMTQSSINETFDSYTKLLSNSNLRHITLEFHTRDDQAKQNEDIKPNTSVHTLVNLQNKIFKLWTETYL